jgi:hypothetical protein
MIGLCAMEKVSVEIERRRPVWQALSDLWLDTEPDSDTFDYIVRVMIESRYSLDELSCIFSYEVAPAVYRNLYNIFPGGTWGAFDLNWLREAIVENMERQARSKLYRCWVRSWLGQKLMAGPVRRNWETILLTYADKLNVPNRRDPA